MTETPHTPAVQHVTDMYEPVQAADDEEWRPVLGWGGFYEASSLGRVRSVDRVVPFRSRHGTTSTKKLHGKLLRQVLDGDKYLVVDLSRDNHAEKLGVHVIILTTFKGPRPAGNQARHLNDIKTDNRSENLEWGTPEQNGEDKARNGCAGHRGEQSTFAKLSGSDVLAIRAASARGQSGANLARQYGINPTSISKLLLGKTWRHITI